jgi:hypothetical protein
VRPPRYYGYWILGEKAESVGVIGPDEMEKYGLTRYGYYDTIVLTKKNTYFFINNIIEIL